MLNGRFYGLWVSVAFAVAASICAGGANAGVADAFYAAPGGSLSIDNNSYGGLNFTTVPDFAGELIDNVVVSVDISKNAPLDQIILILYGPNDGINTRLIDIGAFSGVTGGTNGRVTITFTDAAPSVIGTTSPAGGGTFKPYGSPLSIFNGRNEAGTWSMYIQDTGLGDPTTLYGAHLQVATVPAPPTFVLLLAGLGLFGLIKRVRQAV